MAISGDPSRNQRSGPAVLEEEPATPDSADEPQTVGQPGISDAEHATLVHWLEQGAPYEDPPPLPSDVAQTVLDENTSTVVPGFIGVYPNALYAVPRAKVAEVTAEVGALSSEADYRAAADRPV